MSNAYRTIQELNGHLEEKEREIKELRENEEDKRTELMKQLKDNNNNRDTLLRQLESANNEIMILTQRNTVLQESTLTTRQLEGEVLQLRKSLTDQQHVRMELQQTKEEFETEVGRVKNENGIMKDRLKQSSLQLSDMQHRSEEWRNDRERITKRNKEVLLLQNTTVIIIIVIIVIIIVVIIVVIIIVVIIIVVIIISYKQNWTRHSVK